MSRMIIAAVVLAATLSGCATVYQEPKEGPTSQVRVQMHASHYFLSVGTFRGGVCKDGAHIRLLGASPQWVRPEYVEASKLNMPGGEGVPASQKVERVFPAAPLTLELMANGPVGSTGYGLSSSTCRITFTFHPQANKQYEISHEWAGSRCYVTVDELRGSDASVQRVKVEDITLHEEQCVRF